MKNLPEHEAFKALENRLNNYTEQPDDDVWEKVAGALPPNRPLWTHWMNRFAATVVVAALGWGLWYAVSRPGAPEMLAHPPQSTMQQQALQSDAAQPGEEVSDVAAPGVREATDIDQTTSTAPDPGKGALGSEPAHHKQAPGVRLAPSVGPAALANNQPKPTAQGPARSNALTQTLKTEDSHAVLSTDAKRKAGQGGDALTPVVNPDGSSMHGQAAAPSTTVAREASEKEKTGAPGSSQVSDPQAIAQMARPHTATTPASAQGAPVLTPPSKEELADTQKADSAIVTEKKPPYNSPKKKRGGLSLYTLFSPTVSFQTATPSSRDGVVVQGLSNPSMFGGDRYGMALEIGAQGKLSKKFDYFAGLSVYYQSQKLTYTYLTPGDVVIENGSDDLSYTVKPGSAVRTVSYDMLNLGAQAGVLYTLKTHRLTHKIGLGLQYQKGLASHNAGEPYNNSASSYLNYQVLYRVEMALSDQLTFLLQPSVTRTWIVNEKFDVPFTLKQYRPGISVGVAYRLPR